MQKCKENYLPPFQIRRRKKMQTPPCLSGKLSKYCGLAARGSNAAISLVTQQKLHLVGKLSRRLNQPVNRFQR